MNKLIRYIIDLVFPPRCAVCNEVTLIDTEICGDCFDKLKSELNGIPLCAHCGKPVHSCICHPDMSFSKCVSVFEYCDGTRRLFAKLKDDSDSYAAKQLADMMAERFYKSPLCNIEFDCITYVPSSTKRVASKGFDHAQSLAEQLSLKLNIPCLAPPIEQTTNYRTHHNLSRSERFENANSGYTVSDGKAIGGKVLLVDDIITTGATLDRCAKLLRVCGAEEIFCITAATTFFTKDKDDVPR